MISKTEAGSASQANAVMTFPMRISTAVDQVSRTEQQEFFADPLPLRH